jgi:hypothetical protein
MPQSKTNQTSNVSYLIIIQGEHTTMNKLFKSVASAALAGAVLVSVAATPVFAQEISASGPNEAVAPNSNWVELAPNGSHWYAFDYDYDSGDTPSQAFVELEVAVEDSIGFEVWTPQEVREWANGQKVNPVGAGSELSDDAFTVAWVGSAAASDTYYVIVENNRNVTSNYKLDIFGETVSFSAPQFNGDIAATPAATEAVAVDVVASADIQSDELGLTVEAAPVEAATAGIDPFSALIPNSDWTAIAPGESRYYSFRYDYDDGDLTPSQALVELEMGTENTVEFEIWTGEQVRLWSNGTDFDAVGMGNLKSDFTGNKFHDTKLIWAGSGTASEDFTIVVKNTTDVPAYYSLNVSGEDVTY